MGKAERLARTVGAFADESMGVRVSPRIAPGASPARPPDPRWDDLSRAEVWRVPVGRIDRDPDQPRRSFPAPEIEKMAETLRIHGQLMPIRAWFDEAASIYRIEDGECRWRAAPAAGLDALEVRVVPRPDDPAATLARQLAANVARNALDPIDRADAIARLRRVHGWTTGRIGDEIGLSDETVRRDLAVAALPPEVRGLVGHGEGRLAPSTAAILSRLEGDELLYEARRAASLGHSRAIVAQRVEALMSSSTIPHRVESEPIDVEFEVLRGPRGIAESADSAPQRAPVAPSAQDEPDAPSEGAAADRGPKPGAEAGPDDEAAPECPAHVDPAETPYVVGLGCTVRIDRSDMPGVERMSDVAALKRALYIAEARARSGLADVGLAPGARVYHPRSRRSGRVLADPPTDSGNVWIRLDEGDAGPAQTIPACPRDLRPEGVKEGGRR